jgi:hypothetical protein
MKRVSLKPPCTFLKHCTYKSFTGTSADIAHTKAGLATLPSFRQLKCDEQKIKRRELGFEFSHAASLLTSLHDQIARVIFCKNTKIETTSQINNIIILEATKHDGGYHVLDQQRSLFPLLTLQHLGVCIP